MSRVVIAHVLGAIAIGALEAARLGGAQLGLAVVPLFAATGLIAAVLIWLAERVGKHRSLVTALPALVVLVPVTRTLFDGAYAQTLPLARALPFIAPVVAYLAIAGLVAAGRRIGDDRMWRATGILAVACALGGIVWGERHVLGSGYPAAHTGATVAVIVLAGIAVRIGHRGAVPRVVAAALAGVVLGSTLGALRYGLRDPDDRARLDARGDQARDLVRAWRALLDRDGDGASALLGGGDCDDGDPTRHPGAIDIPGDGIDQDCDGADAVAPPAPVVVTQS